MNTAVLEGDGAASYAARFSSSAKCTLAFPLTGEFELLCPPSAGSTPTLIELLLGQMGFFPDDRYAEGSSGVG